MLKRAVMLLVVALVFAGCASPTNENPSPTIENVSPTVENSKPVEETTTPFDETASLTDENVTSAAEVDPTDTAIPATEDTSTPEEETEPEPSETAVDTDGSMTSFPDRDDTIGLVEYCWKNPGSCIGHGDPMAQVIMVEISDYGCGHCMNFNLNTAPVLEELYVEDGKVFWLVLPFALSEDRVPSAASAMCAAEQDAFTQYHRRMFEIFSDSDARTQAGFMRIAGELGLDVNAFKECIESGKYDSVVRQNVVIASALGISSTPTFAIQDQALVGNYPLENFQQWIDSELQGGS